MTGKFPLTLARLYLPNAKLKNNFSQKTKPPREKLNDLPKKTFTPFLKEKEIIEAAIIYSKYALLKNAEELNNLQKDQLKEIGEILPELATMHKMKESFRDIFESRINWSEALFKLCDWIVESEQKFPKSCGTIKRWIGEIVSYFDNRTTQGVVEGINNKLKLIKRRGYGFRNFDNFQIRSMLSWHFSN